MGLTVKSHSLTGEPDEQTIRRELERVIAGRVFRGSRRCQTFLQYVVSKTLEGDGKSLKERTLAIEVFGREPTEDLSEDSIVRVSAREVRKRLAQYYVDEGANDPLRIELPPGSYIPVFQAHTAAASSVEIELPGETVPAETRVSPPPPTRGRTYGKAAILGAVLVLAGVAIAGSWRLLAPAATAFDTFWQPAFQGNSPAIIAIAHPIAYQPSRRAQRLDEDENGHPKPPIQRPINVRPELLNGSDFVPALNQFVGFGDAEAAVRLASLFARHSTTSRVQLASRMDFNDLRGSGTVLIGAYTNRWTMELTKNMRYRFEYQADGKPCIAEANVGCRWTLAKSPDGRSAEDYILLCRLPHSATSSFIVVCAGLNGYGTDEAGRIISDPDALMPFLRSAPKSWSSHNLEMVLHLAVVGDAPAQSELVSAYSW